MKRLLLSTGIALAAIAAASPASAVTVTIGAANTGLVDVSSLYKTSTTYDFNSGTGPFTGGIYGSATVANQYAQPSNDSTPFFVVTPGNSPATLAVSGINQVSFYWGSLDAYNTITFTGPGNTTIASYTGAQIDATANPNSLNSREVTFTFGAGETVTGISLSSTDKAFEIDNFVVGTAVPEPATYGIMSLGLGLIGAVLRRRRKTAGAGSYSVA